MSHYKWMLPLAILAFAILAVETLWFSGPAQGGNLPPATVIADIESPELEPVIVPVQAEEIVGKTTSNAGIALISADGGVVVDSANDDPYVLASVGKLFVLVSFLDSIGKAGREPTIHELDLLRDMIQVSDNDAATTLWRQAGGISSLQLLLSSHGLAPVVEPDNGSWGSMSATAGDVATLLTELYGGTLLDAGHTALALSLMRGVDDSQSWGVSAGLYSGETVLLKNGWYPEDDGWRINSAGIIETSEGAYALVILSDSQASYTSGIAAVEVLATSMNEYMLASGV